MTTATITFHSNIRATLEITYANGAFSFARLDRARRETTQELYERGYRIANHCAAERGFRLERYCRA